MPRHDASDIITRLTVARNKDNERAAGHVFKLPAGLRTDVDNDLAALIAAETATDPTEAIRAGASGARRDALKELERALRGGHRGIGAIDETTITEAQRLQVYTAYGWESGELGEFTDGRVISLARLAPTVSVTEVGGTAAWLYPAARLARIAAQLAIIDALEGTATGADREAATNVRDAALSLAADTLLRVRFFYCSATRDVDATPELARIGYQPRRAPGEAGGGGEEEGELSQAPDNVGITAGAAGSGANSVTWDERPPEEGVTLYNVYDSASGTLLGSVAHPPFEETGHEPGEAISREVSSVNPAGESAHSGSVSGNAG